MKILGDEAVSTLWVTDEVVDCWRAAPRHQGGQPYFSDLAIETALMLRLAFHLPLCQTQGLMSSVFYLLGVLLKVPNYSILSRRAKTLKSISLGSITQRLIGSINR